MPYTLQSRVGEASRNAPKYQSDMPSWACVVLGEHCAVSVTADPLVHATLVGYPDVVQSSSNIDAAMGWVSSLVNSAFEAAGYPGDSTNSTTWREAFRVLCAAGQFLHRTGENSPLRGIGRGVQFRNLPEAIKVKLRRAAASQGFDLRGLDTTTLRSILRLAGANYRGKIRISGEEL